MPAWPGGPCPECGEDMPANLVHCRGCRALLNDDLTDDSVEIPMFIPLQEIESMVELKPQGFYIGCPHCKRELRINGKYVNQTVSCKFCSGQFQFDLANPLIETIAYYARCPHCENELRMGRKYAGLKVACKECGGKIQIVV